MSRVAGVDEVGRGPLAGPVVAAAVILPAGYANERITDSKKLAKKTRETLSAEIEEVADEFSIVAVGPRRIEKLNILQATRLAMRLAVERINPDSLLIDGNVPIDTLIPQTTVVKGDQKHIEIAAASILAKVWRDRLMSTLDEKYPGYSLGTHAGYPTKAHKESVQRLGPSPIHRKTFRGVLEHIRQ